MTYINTLHILAQLAVVFCAVGLEGKIHALLFLKGNQLKKAKQTNLFRRKVGSHTLIPLDYILDLCVCMCVPAISHKHQLESKSK